MIGEVADADLFSSDYAAGSDENRCAVLKDGLKITGRRDEPPSLPHHAAQKETRCSLASGRGRVQGERA